MARIEICADSPAGSQTYARAEALASRLALPLRPHPSRDYEILLVVTDHRLEARWRDGTDKERRSKPICVDLRRVDIDSPSGRTRRQPIAKAVGLRRGQRPPWIVDATAGYGEDAWLLAALGCSVRAWERSPVVTALLADGLNRMTTLRPDVTARITLEEGDSRTRLAQLAERPDVVYLDPMFPPRRKSALEAKRIRFLRHLVGADHDTSALIQAAFDTRCRRVVVKRPSRAPIGAPVPTQTYRGKSVRYDVYVQV